MKLANKTAVVTGGASGLGAATVARFLEAGARVAILDRDAALGAAVAGRAGGAAVFIDTDVTDEVSAERAFMVAEQAFGPVHICINCAGVGGMGPIATPEGPLPLAEFRRILDINLTGTFNTARLAGARMIHNDPDPDTGERGVIVNTASISAYEGQAGMAAYSASKAGIVGMTLPMARDLSPHGVRVMTIAPGLFDTPLLAGLPADFLGYLHTLNEFPKRGGDPAEFAALVSHIVENPYLNAETIRIDAGTRAPPR